MKSVHFKKNVNVKHELLIRDDELWELYNTFDYLWHGEFGESFTIRLNKLLEHFQGDVFFDFVEQRAIW